MVGRGLGPSQLRFAEEEPLDGMLSLSKQFFLDTLNSTVEFDATLGIIPDNQNGPGVFIVPYGDLNLNTSFGDWNFEMMVGSTIPGFEINRDGIKNLSVF